MKSLDTNILIYAAAEDCAEHVPARALIEGALNAPEDWILADQVLFEFYKALRNPRVFARPLEAGAAAERVIFLREESGFARCCYELRSWPEMRKALLTEGFPYQRTHDQVLAVTLKRNGVRTFYTRNCKDFETAGFEQLINPIDGA